MTPEKARHVVAEPTSTPPRKLRENDDGTGGLGRCQAVGEHPNDGEACANAARGDSSETPEPRSRK